MDELIRINFDSDRPTVSGRDLYAALEVRTAYKDWFPRMCDYGFEEGTDFCSFLSESTGGRPATDHQLTIAMAKELCMIQRSEAGRKFRQYFIKIEEAWNSPEAVMARALQFANNQLSLVKKQNLELLETVAVQNQQIAEMKPKASYYDVVLNCKDLISTSAIAKDYGKSAIWMNRYLHDKGVQFKQGDIWLLYLYIDKYNEDNNFHINYLKQCKIESLEYENLNRVFKWLAEYDSVDKAILLKIKIIEKIPPYNNSDLINFTRKLIGDVNIQINKINPVTQGRKYIGFITNLLGKNEINIKWSANKEFKNISCCVNQEDNIKEKYLFIYTNNDNEQDAMAKVLEQLKYGKEQCNYIKNYIQTGNITELSSREFYKFIKQKRLAFDYPFTYEELLEKKIDANISMDSIYTILSGEMSYDDHCPICNTIPTLNIMETDMNNLKKRNCLVAMLLGKYKEKSIHVKIICCKSCFDRYKNTLTSAKIEEKNELKKLILKEKISSAICSRNITTEILLSPDNWKLIKNLNGID